MDHTLAKERENRCIQEQLPACSAACPVHVDVRGMIREVRQENINAGFAVFNKTVPFPRIISRLCSQPCRQACRRAEVGEAIAIRAVERFCTDHASTVKRQKLLLPSRGKTVAVVGAGLSGLTAAVDLARKGYQVTLYEAAAAVGGRLRQFVGQELPADMLEADLAILAELAVTVRTGMRVGDTADSMLSLDEVTAGYDAVYLAAGTGNHALLSDASQTNVFCAGQRQEEPYSPIASLQVGRAAATTIDRFLQQASQTAGRDGEGPYRTKLYTDLTGIEPQPETAMADTAAGYSAAEAAKEAARCLQCQCLECVKQCEYLAQFGAYPKRYVREIYNNDSIVMGIRHGNKLVNSCMLCGLCQKVCPVQFDMAPVCLEARESLVEKGKMPPSAHDFALRDLEFSCSEAFFLARSQPGSDTCCFLFFPGCQLCASSPDHVIRLYEYIREKTGSAGILLGCCGAPADWAGRQELFRSGLENLREEWRRLGSPRLIATCSTCYKILVQHLPDVPAESLWSWLEREGLPEAERTYLPPAVAVHDPCTTREYPAIQASVRSILRRLGVSVDELALSGELTGCCGFGGLVTFANPELAGRIAARRAAEGPADYLAYCAMCRDVLAKTGKRTFHLLDLLLGSESDQSERRGPDLSERRLNRVRLKERLLREVWCETPPVQQTGKLLINEAVRAKMEQRWIVTEDISRVIAFAESSGKVFYHRPAASFLAHQRLAEVIYWVEYRPEGPDWLILNAYSHRMVLAETAAGAKQPESASGGGELVCQSCNVPLTMEKVTVSYLNSSFPVELLQCRQCGAVFVPEKLALGKMLEVEKALEDK